MHIEEGETIKQIIGPYMTDTSLIVVILIISIGMHFKIFSCGDIWIENDKKNNLGLQSIRHRKEILYSMSIDFFVIFNV